MLTAGSAPCLRAAASALLLLATAAPAGAAAGSAPEGRPPAAAAPDSEDAVAIRGLEQGWAKALLGRDQSWFETVLAPEFVQGFDDAAGMSLTSRRDWLAMNALLDFREYEIGAARVAVTDRTAVAVMEGHWLVYVPADDVPKALRFLISDRWTKSGDGWRLLFRHVGRADAAQSGVRPR